MLNQACINSANRHAIPLPVRLHGPPLGAILVEQDGKDALKFATNGVLPFLLDK